MRRMIERPMLFAVIVLAATVACARFNSWAWPRLHLQLGAGGAGVHLHHYVIGIFILTAVGYLALIFKGPRATLGIALLYGLGVGLTFDEFGFWANPPFVRGVRWNNYGLLIVVSVLAAITVLRQAWQWRKRRAGVVSEATRDVR